MHHSLRSVTLLLTSIAAFALGALGGCGDDRTPASVSPPLAAYEAGDPCHAHADATSCDADPACGWLEVGACPAGTDCPAGFCSSRDACAGHADRSTCEADASCAWADLELASACPAPDCATRGGVCYSRSDPGGDDCLCACPLYCPMGSDCPPCECSCPPPGGGGGGGGTCTCACAACAPGETCPDCGPCTCEPGGGSECGGTCTCACPDCAPGEACPPCACSCDPGGVPGEPPPPPEPTTTCACEACPAGVECPPCDCAGSDPCYAHADSATCTADTANMCVWYALGLACPPGMTCPSGVCQREPTGGGTPGCACGCPACAPGETCPPCACDCSGGSSGGGCPPPAGGV